MQFTRHAIIIIIFIQIAKLPWQIITEYRLMLPIKTNWVRTWQKQIKFILCYEKYLMLQ